MKQAALLSDGHFGLNDGRTSRTTCAAHAALNIRDAKEGNFEKRSRRVGSGAQKEEVADKKIAAEYFTD